MGVLCDPGRGLSGDMRRSILPEAEFIPTRMSSASSSAAPMPTDVRRRTSRPAPTSVPCTTCLVVADLCAYVKMPAKGIERCLRSREDGWLRSPHGPRWVNSRSIDSELSGDAPQAGQGTEPCRGDHRPWRRGTGRHLGSQTPPTVRAGSSPSTRRAQRMCLRQACAIRDDFGLAEQRRACGGLENEQSTRHLAGRPVV